MNDKFLPLSGFADRENDKNPIPFDLVVTLYIHVGGGLGYFLSLPQVYFVVN